VPPDLRPHFRARHPTRQRRYQELVDNATKVCGDVDARLDRYLADPADPIPIHAGSGDGRGGVHWSLLTLMLGAERAYSPNGFRTGLASGRQLIARVEEAVASGHRTTTGVVDGLAAIQRGDGTSSPGIRGSAPARWGWNATCFATPATCS
jgi:hypothetical protein